MNQHYVPRFYLKKWANDRARKSIYVLYTDFSSYYYGTAKRFGIRKTCSIIDLYEPLYKGSTLISDYSLGDTQIKFPLRNGELENKFDKIETECANHINRIIKAATDENLETALICDCDDKMALAKYIVLQITRHPIAIAMFDEENIKEAKDGIIESQLCHSHIDNKAKDTLIAIGKDMNYYRILSDLKFLPDNVCKLKILLFLRGTDFVASETPILLPEKVDGDIPNIWLPLSPSIGVYVCERKKGVRQYRYRNKMFLCKNEAELNMMTVDYAYRNKMCVIGKSETQLNELWDKYKKHSSVPERT